MSNTQSSFKYTLFAIIALLCASNIALADLVAYWTFNDYANGTLLSATTDSSGNGFTCNNVGDANNRPFISSSNQMYGNHLQRNNATAESKSNCGLSAANVYTGNMTISFWGTQPGTNWRNYITLRTGSTGEEFQFQKANNGMMVYKTDSSNKNATGMVGDSSINLGSNWHHFVVTVDSSTQMAYMYIDGELISQKAWTHNQQVTNLTFNGAWNFGGRGSNANLDEVQIYNQSMTAEQVQFLYNNPSLYQATVYQRNATANGNWSDAAWNANGQTGQAFANSSAVQFNAQNSPSITLDKNVTVNSIDFTGTTTVSGSSTITLNGEKRIGVANAGDVATISVPITAQYDNSFVKTGAGTLELTTANTFAGGTTVSEGTLKLSGDGAVGSVTVADNGALELGYDSNKTYDSAISGTGSVVKSGAGTLTLSGSYSYTGETTVSGGTLVFPKGASLQTSKITVATESAQGATFHAETDMYSVDFEIGRGGTFVFGETSASQEFSISSLTLSGGTVNFDFNSSAAEEADWLKPSSITLNSGCIDLSFNTDSSDVWWNYINDNYSGGFSIIDGYITNYEQFNPDNIKVSVNGTPSNSWAITADPGHILLLAVDGGDDPGPGPQPVSNWYDANTSDISLQNWTIDGTDKVGAKFTEGGSDAEYSGSVIMNANGSFDVAENKNLTLSGVVSGSGSVTKTGAGTLTLSNAPGWTGNTMVNAGTLQLGADSTLSNLSGTNAEGVHGTVDYGATNLTLNNTADTEFAGVISGSGSVAKTGANTLTLSGVNTYTGATTVSAGELVFSGSSLPVSAMTTTGGTLVLGSAGNTIVAPNGSSFKISSGNIRVDGNVEINSGTVTVKGDWTGNGDIKVNSGSQLRVTTNLSYDKGITLNGGTFRNATDGRTVTVNAPINVTANSYLQAGWSETVTLNGALKGSGNITIPDDSGWVIFAGNDSNYTGSLLVQGKMRVGASGTDVSDSKALIGSKEITFNGGTIQNNNNNLTITNDVKLNSESYFKAGWSKKLTLTGAITGSGKFHVLSDSGWVIAATTCTDNSFTGSVHTDNDSNPYGLLRLGTDNPFGANAGEARIWGTLDMNGYSQTFEGVANSDSTSSGTVRGTSSSVLTLKLNNSASKVFGGKIENGLNLVLTGDGTGVQTLKQAPAYTGYTRIEAGTLILSSGGTLYNLSGNALGTVNNNGKAITLNNSSTTEFAGVIKGAGSLTKTGAGKLTLSGANAYTGATTVSEGTLVLASSGSLTSNVTVASGAAFIDGASSIASNVTINGGAFTIGDTSAASRISIGDFALTDGAVNFDFNSASTANNFDSLTTGAAMLTAGSVNLLFNNGDEAAWWNNATDSGYVLISSTALTANLDNIALLINSSATENWYLATEDNALVLKKTEGPEPPPVVDYYYRANSEQDLAQDSWTIDGTDKQGVKFTEGDENAVTYSGGVAMEDNGSFEVADGKNLTLAGIVSGDGEVEKIGDGTLTLSGNNTNTGKTTVSEGTLALTGATVKANNSIEVAQDATLEYNVAAGDSKQLTFSDDVTVSGSGDVVKTGAGKLKILAADGQFESNTFAVNAGELDFKGQYNGDLTVKSGATLSPGNSVGDLTVYGDVKIDASGTLLFEFSPYNADPAMQEFDTLAITDASNELVLDTNSIVKLFFTSAADANLWAAEGEEYKLVSDEGFVADVTDMSDLLGNYTSLFALQGRPDGLYLIGLGAGPAPEPGSGVPEPSTWALLVLGVVVLFLRKRVRS